MRITRSPEGRFEEVAVEARMILRAVASAQLAEPRNLAEAIRARFARYGGVELETMPREPVREPPPFD